MAPNGSNLVAEIDALRARLEARLDDYVAEERGHAGGTLVPEGVHRNILLRGSTNFFEAMRRLISERG